MWNPYESPWLLLFLAAGVLCVVQVVRWVKPDKNLAWLLALPVLLAISAFALDISIQTDLEKINTAVSGLRKAALQKDVAAIEELVHPQYADPVNASPEVLFANLEHAFNLVEIEKINIASKVIQIPRENSSIVTCEYAVHLQQDESRITAPPLFLLKVNLYFLRTPGREWLLTTIEPLEYNRNSINWGSLPRR